MNAIASLVGTPSSLELGGGDTLTDRLSSSHTVFLLLVFAAVVTGKQYFQGEPVACFVPSHFSMAQKVFINQVCWTQDTYYLPLSEERIPKGQKGKMYISYYQWVALVLTCQALLFYLPRPIWRLFNKKSGIAVSTLTDAAIECQRKMDPESRDKVMKYIVKHLGRFLVELSRNHLLSTTCRGFWWTVYGNYLIIMYCVIKLVYLGNVLCQIMWLNRFLGTDFHMYGFRVLGHMMEGENWRTSERFPRVTLCDFSIRTLGNIHNYTVQCSLPLNLFNEKIFIFVWFWFSFVAVATVFSLFLWIGVSIHIPHQCTYIKSRLIAMDKLQQGETIDTFVRNFLRRDGMFLIRMVAKNSSDLIAAEIICGLWDHYKENRRIIERLECRDAIHKQARATLIQQMSDVT